MRHAAELELLEVLGEGAAAVGVELEMELLEFLGEGAAHAAVEFEPEFGLEMEVAETESTDMHAEDFDEELGWLVAKFAFLYQAQNLQQSFGHCLSEYFEYFDYFPYCSVDCSASSGIFDGRSHPLGKNLS